MTHPIYAAWREDMKRPVIRRGRPPLYGPPKPKATPSPKVCAHGCIGAQIGNCRSCHPRPGQSPCPHGIFPKRRCKPCYNARRRADWARRYARNPEPTLAAARAWRHSRRYAGGAITGAQYRAILKRDRWCVYCKLCRSTGVDHVIPLSRGGTNSRENLRGACHGCNSSKRHRLLGEWPGRWCPACGMATGEKAYA